MEHFELEPILILGIIFWGIVAILREVSQNKLRHRIVDKGLDPDDVKSLFRTNGCCSQFGALKWGMVLVGIGLVLLAVQLIPGDVPEEAAIGGMMLVAGVALLVFHFIASRATESNRGADRKADEKRR